MKFLGKVSDPKDITTKEYVDSADAELRELAERIDESKVGAEDIVEYTATEVKNLWSSLFKRSKAK